MKISLGGQSVNINARISIIIGLLTLKLLYMITVDMMLPEYYDLWDFNKSVDWIYVFFEIIPFFICLYIYLGIFRKGSAYSCISTMLFIMYFIPNNCGLSLSGYDPLYYSCVNTFCIFLFVILRFMARHEKNFTGEHFEIEQIWKNKKLVRTVRMVTVLVCMATLVYVYLYNGIDFSYVMSSMYLIRAEYASFAVEIQGSLASYVIMIVIKTGSWMLLIGLFYSIMARKPVDIALFIFTYLALFTLEMQKNTLLIVLVVIFVAWAERNNKLKNFSATVIKAMLIFFVTVLFEYIIRGDSYLFHLVVRRMFYIPAYLTNIYYELFSKVNNLWFTQDVFLVKNVLGVLIGHTQPAGAVRLVSEYCFDGLIPSPNTGLFAEAYAQMGLLSIFVFPFFYVALIKFMRGNSKWYGEGVTMIIMVKLSLTLLNTQAFTTVNMVGFIMFGLITFIFFKGKNRRKTKTNAHSQYSINFNI